MDTPRTALTRALARRLEGMSGQFLDLIDMAQQLEEMPPDAPAAAAPAPAPATPPVDDAALARIAQENLELSHRLVEAEEMNSAMMNMYVSSYQLHATLDPDRVVAIVKDVVINLVGAEEFAVLLRDEEGDDLEVVAGEEHLRRYPRGRAEVQGVLGAVVASGEPFVHAEEGEAREGILAAVPLGSGGRVVGAVVISRLLAQKARLQQSDVELLHLLSSHAATALVNARVHRRVERKLRTMEKLLAMLTGGDGDEDRPSG
jgi:transcriptional regulator with GAF, ATPase, and Fis domain